MFLRASEASFSFLPLCMYTFSPQLNAFLIRLSRICSKVFLDRFHVVCFEFLSFDEFYRDYTSVDCQTKYFNKSLSFKCFTQEQFLR